MKFKLGDKVRVLDGSSIKDYSGGWNGYMMKFVGNVYTIRKRYENSDGTRFAYQISDDVGGHLFDERGLELVERKPEITREDFENAVVRVMTEDKDTAQLLSDVPILVAAFIPFVEKLGDELFRKEK